MNSKFIMLLVVGLSSLLLYSCRKEETDMNIRITGTVNLVEPGKKFTRESFTGIIVMAVNANSEIFAGDTDDDGNFMITAPERQEYVIFFYNTASQLLGILEYNEEVMAIAVGTSSINLGVITIEGGVAVSANEEKLAGFFTTTEIQQADDVVFNENTETICSFFYNPMNDGDICIYKGCGDCLPAEIDNRLRISVCVHEYDPDLKMTVCAVRNYYLVPGITDDLVTAFPGDVLYWYITSKGMVQYKIVRGPGEVSPGAGEIPDFLNVGKEYVLGDLTVTVLSTFTQTTFPTLGEGLFDGFVVEFREEDDTRYDWVVKDIGDLLYTSANSTVDDGNNIRMKVIYKKTGAKTYGTKPIWLTDQFVDDLPDPASWPTEKKNMLSFFGADSWFPVAAGLTWTYNDGTSVAITAVDTVNNTFRISNLTGIGYMDGLAGNSELGHYIAASSYTNPDFLPVSNGTGYNPLIFEDSRIFKGLTFQKTGISNGYRIITTVTYESLDYDLVTPGLTEYNDCLVIRCSFSYPDGYNYSPRISEVTHFVKKGVGFVQKIKKMSDNTETISYVVSYR